MHSTDMFLSKKPKTLFERLAIREQTTSFGVLHDRVHGHHAAFLHELNLLKRQHGYTQTCVSTQVDENAFCDHMLS